MTAGVQLLARDLSWRSVEFWRRRWLFYSHDVSE